MTFKYFKTYISCEISRTKNLQQEGDGSHTLASDSRNKRRHERSLGKGYTSHRTNKKIPG
jgi:hypothetical protein